MDTERRRKKSFKFSEALSEELKPTTVKRWRALHSDQILRVRFDNGEENMVEIKNVEPADDFLPPCTGSTVCCKVKGGKYSAEILAIENVVPKQCKNVATAKKQKAVTPLKETSNLVKRQKKTQESLKEKEVARIQLDYFSSDSEDDTTCASDSEKAVQPAITHPDIDIDWLLEEKLRSHFGQIRTFIQDQLAPINEKLVRIEENLNVGTGVNQTPPYPDSPLPRDYTLRPPTPNFTPLPPTPHQSFRMAMQSPVPAYPDLPLPLDTTLPVFSYTPADTYCQSPHLRVRPSSSVQPNCQSASSMQTSPTAILKDQYVDVGEVRVLSERLKAARKAPTAYRMGRKLLPEFFSPAELKTCTCVPHKPGAKTVREQADSSKMKLLLDEVRKVYPGGWDEQLMNTKLNQAFIDYRNKH